MKSKSIYVEKRNPKAQTKKVELMKRSTRYTSVCEGSVLRFPVFQLDEYPEAVDTESDERKEPPLDPVSK